MGGVEADLGRFGRNLAYDSDGAVESGGATVFEPPTRRRRGRSMVGSEKARARARARARASARKRDIERERRRERERETDKGREREREKEGCRERERELRE